MFDGRKDRRSFRENGKEFLRYYIEFCGLEPDAAVLDVGSGIGRKTVPLTRYLSPSGRYEGIEIVREGVDWCVRHINARYPNFTFHWLDIRNETFNPTGRIEPTDVRFPFADSQFDLVVLGSVFTHLLEPVVEHYTHEIARVLEPGGKALITYFLLNDDARSRIADGAADFTFTHHCGRSRIDDAARPGAAVAYYEAFVRALYGKVGLDVVEPVLLGAWAGRDAPWGNEYGNYQDMVIGSKRDPGAHPA